MAEPQSPFEYDDTWAYARPPRERDPAKMSLTDVLRAADELRAGTKSDNPADPLRWAKGLLPEENKSLPKPKFVMDPRAMSLTNMIRGSLDTAANWLDGVKKPEKITPPDMIGPLGGAGLAAAGMTKPMAGGLSAFIGPGQVERLGLTPGSRGSLEALEKAQATWAKGGTDPGALAETWAKHGWAPPESFGVQGHPFSWMEMPDLRLRDDVMDLHQSALAKPETYGGTVTTETRLRDMFEPGRDLDRLLQSTPAIGDANVKFKTGQDFDYNGVAGTRDPSGRPLKVSDFQPTDMVPLPNHFEGVGPDPFKAESILIGHELRGHGMPKHGGTQLRTIEEFSAPRKPLWDIPAVKKLEAERDRSRAEWMRNYTADPAWGSTMEAHVMKRWPDTLKEMQEAAARGAAYFAQPEERMARHAHMLDQFERQGKNPFAPNHAPGVMSTYTPRSLIDDSTFHKTVNSEELYSMRDMLPRVKSPFDLVPTD